MQSNDLTLRLKPLLSSFLQERGFEANLDDDWNLRQLGLTSIDYVNLILQIEHHFDISLRDEHVVLSNFQDNDALLRMLSFYIE
ncbi:hypothetical protein I6F07_17335 [Ensifer sp. IC4062]|nr:hypothetical protein [Ensifer sp. IC4062]